MAFFGFGAKQAIRAPPEIKGRIRGPKLEVLVEGARGATFLEALELANGQKRVIASNKRLDSVLVGMESYNGPTEKYSCGLTVSDSYLLPGPEYRELKSALGYSDSCWSGTMCAYAEPGKKMGKRILSVDSETGQRHVFPVPQEYWKVRNGILVIEHPNYALVQDGRDLIVVSWRESDVNLLNGFPGENWRCLPDEGYGIPLGRKEPHTNLDARVAQRKWKGACVAPVQRRGSDREYLDFNPKWNKKASVIVEMPEQIFDEAS